VLLRFRMVCCGDRCDSKMKFVLLLVLLLVTTITKIINLILVDFNNNKEIIAIPISKEIRTLNNSNRIPTTTTTLLLEMALLLLDVNIVDHPNTFLDIVEINIKNNFCTLFFFYLNFKTTLSIKFK